MNTNELENIAQIDKFLDTYNKHTSTEPQRNRKQEQRTHIKTESVLRFPPKKSPEPACFTAEF